MRIKMIAVATALFMTMGTVPAYAEAAAVPTTLESILAADPGALGLVADAPNDSGGANAITADLQQVHIDVPVDPAAGIALQLGGHALSIGLPFAGRADKAISEQPGVVSFDNNNGSITVPVVKSNGSVQINTVIDGPEAPQHYAYVLHLPLGSYIKQEGGGLLLLDAEGENLGAIAAPWAFDAKGKAVPTHYEVSGTTITQVVDHSTDFQYPIVADPTYIAPITIMYSRADVERMWNVMNFTGSICKFAPLPYLASLACSAPATLADAVASAHYQKKRIKALYYQCNSGSWCNYYTYKIVT